jgi:hypothetical protein
MKKTTTTKKTAKKLPYVIARCNGAGVHAGEMVSSDGKGRVVLRNSRRIWYWDGAASLSEIAVYGASKPGKCRFAAKVEKTEVLDCKEIIYCQQAGRKMIEEQPEWRA